MLSAKLSFRVQKNKNLSDIQYGKEDLKTIRKTSGNYRRFISLKEASDDFIYFHRREVCQVIRFDTTNYVSLLGNSGYSSNSNTNSIYSSISQLSSVQSGAYTKALKALYGKSSNTNTKTNASSVLKKSDIKYTVDSELSGVKKETRCSSSICWIH